MHKMVQSYDEVHNNRYWKEVTPYIREAAAKNVLDIGCGPGLLLRDIESNFHSNHLYGLDMSEVMLEKASEVLEQVGKKVTLIQQHMQEDQHLPGNIDLILSSRVLRSFEDQKAVFEAMHNSLNLDGMIVILDWSKGSISTYEAWFKEQNNEFDDLSPEEVISYHRNFSRYDLEDWSYIFEAFKFEVVHAFQVNPVICCIIGRKTT